MKAGQGPAVIGDANKPSTGRPDGGDDIGEDVAAEGTGVGGHPSGWRREPLVSCFGEDFSSEERSDAVDAGEAAAA